MTRVADPPAGRRALRLRHGARRRARAARAHGRGAARRATRCAKLTTELDELERDGGRGARAAGRSTPTRIATGAAHLKYEGTDVALPVAWEKLAVMRRRLRGSCTAPLRVRHGGQASSSSTPPRSRRSAPVRRSPPAIAAPAVAAPASPPGVSQSSSPPAPKPFELVETYTSGAVHETLVYRRDDLRPADRLPGPAIIAESTGTTVVEPGWRAETLPVVNSCSRACTRCREPPTSAPPVPRCCSRSSTTSSCRSPSRWARRWPTPPTR